MLKFRRSNTASPQDVEFPSLSRTPANVQLDRKCSFVTSQMGHSKAAVLLRNLSIPLAWPVDEYFGTKREWREFTVQLALCSGSNKQFSKPLEHINRTYTDVDFSDEFVFADQAPNFNIELTVYCKRSDEVASTVQTISRSLGRSIGLSWRRYQQQQHDNAAHQQQLQRGAPNRTFLEELRRAGIREEQRLAASKTDANKRINMHPFYPSTLDEDILEGSWHDSGVMCPIAIAHFRLCNATLSGRTHSYILSRRPQATGTFASGISKQHLLPIYGNISAQILVQPTSLVSPLAQGSLDIFLSDVGILHPHLRCTLQGGQLRCWQPNAIIAALENNSGTQVAATDSLPKLAACKTPLLSFQMDENTKLERTAFPTALRLVLENGKQHLLCICPTQRALIGWRNALQLQLLDCSFWGEFAYTQRNPHAAALGCTLPGTSPPPFQPLVADFDTTTTTMMPEKHQQTAEMQDDQTLEKLQKRLQEKEPESDINNENRVRASSSASMLVRNIINQQKASAKLHSTQEGTHPSSTLTNSIMCMNESDTTEKMHEIMYGKIRPAGPSRTTLLDTTASQSSPIAARKIIATNHAEQQQQPSPLHSTRSEPSSHLHGSTGPFPPHSPRSMLFRRLTQLHNKQRANDGLERHISLSLGRQGKTTTAAVGRTIARQIFQTELQNLERKPEAQSQTINEEREPKVTTPTPITPTAEELPQQEEFSCSNVIEQQQENVTVEQSNSETATNGQEQMLSTTTPRGKFVISLCIDGDANVPTTFPSPSAPIMVSTTNDVAINVPASNDQSSSDKMNVPLPNDAIAVPATPHRIHVNATTKISRPFNVNNLHLAASPSTADYNGRWASAKVARCETWHFARTSEAFTRL